MVLLAPGVAVPLFSMAMMRKSMVEQNSLLVPVSSAGAVDMCAQFIAETVTLRGTKRTSDLVGITMEYSVSSRVLLHQ